MGNRCNLTNHSTGAERQALKDKLDSLGIEYKETSTSIEIEGFELVTPRQKGG